jgi:anti-sigma factor RsiW
MNCNEIDRLLDDYVDGELDRDREPAVREHLTGCPRCRDREAGLRRLLHLAGSLPREARPDRDLWQGIRDRIEPTAAGKPSRPGHLPVWLAAAAVILTGVLAFVVLRDGGPGPVEEVARKPDASEVITAAYQQVVDEYRQARDVLQAQLDLRKDELDPETVKVIESNLEIMDQAAGEIRLALERDPGNRGLERMMLASYRKQVDLLKQANTIPAGM